VFEEVGYFPHFRAVICKCGPFCAVYVFLFVCFLAGSVTLYLLFEFGYQFVHGCTMHGSMNIKSLI